jgi:FkbM family methyltransferase
MSNWLRLNFRNSAIECIITSETESARVRKIKEIWTAEWAANLPRNAVFYDIGSNIGIMSLLACEDKDKGVRSVAVEPAVTNFVSLFSNIKRNGLEKSIIPLQAGLGEQTCLTDLLYQNIEPGGALHSFNRITQFKPNRSTIPVITVSTICFALDDLVFIAGMPFPTHLKIDVDGTELSILKGARQTLRDPRLQEIQVEAVDFTEQNEISDPIIDFLEQSEFAVSSVFHHNFQLPLVRDFRFVRRKIA